MGATRIGLAAVLVAGLGLTAAYVASITSTNIVGTTPGQFEVNANGAGTYTVPIQAPPGINGMEPKLALAYSPGL